MAKSGQKSALISVWVWPQDGDFRAHPKNRAFGPRFDGGKTSLPERLLSGRETLPSNCGTTRQKPFYAGGAYIRRAGCHWFLRVAREQKVPVRSIVAPVFLCM